MLNQATLERMQTMKMSAMAEAFQQQLASRQSAELSFEERFGLLIDTEWTAREQRKLARRLKGAKLRYPASLEDVDFKAPRGLDRQVVLSLGTCAWIQDHHNLIITGLAGTGKTYLACALVERACRAGYTASYVRAPRLLQSLSVARADGSYARLLLRLAKLDLLALDDWLISSLKDPERRDLLEVIEDRSERSATLVATQLPVSAWHAAIGEPTMADAICDRLIHRAHRIDLAGKSLRDPQDKAERPAKSKGK
jgi:DNA replication protein DnaC